MNEVKDLDGRGTVLECKYASFAAKFHHRLCCFCLVVTIGDNASTHIVE